MEAIVGTINQERALVEAFSVIVKTSEGLFPALLSVLPLQSYTMQCSTLPPVSGCTPMFVSIKPTPELWRSAADLPAPGTKRSIACTAPTRVIVRYYSEIFCIQSHKKLFHWWIPPDCWIRSSVGLRRWQWHVSSQDSTKQLSWTGAVPVRVTPAPMTFI